MGPAWEGRGLAARGSTVVPLDIVIGSTKVTDLDDWHVNLKLIFLVVLLDKAGRQWRHSALGL